MAHTPPLRITSTDGTFNHIPCYELQISGGVLTKVSPTKVNLAISGSLGPSGPPGASLVYAPTGGPYLVFAANDTLTAEKLVTASDNIVITTDATTFWISATTGAGTGTIYAPTGGEYITFAANNTLSAEKVLTASDNITVTTDSTTFWISATTSDVSGKQDNISFPLIVGSGGTGLTTSGGNYQLLGVSAGLAYISILASDNTTITNVGSAIYISATTNAAAAQNIYAPTGGPYITFVANDTLSAEKVLTASDNITLTTDANTIWVSATTNATPATVFFAPTGGEYITFAANNTLTAEKVLTASDNITITTDANTVWISASTNAASSVAYAPSGAMYVVLSAHDILSAEKVLTASDNITLTTDANTVWISATTNSATGATYAPTGGFYISYSAQDVLTAEKVLTSGTGTTVRTDATAVYIDVVTSSAVGTITAGSDGNIAVYRGNGTTVDDSLISITTGSGVAHFNINYLTSDPASPNAGDMWVLADSDALFLRAYSNSTVFNIGSGGSGSSSVAYAPSGAYYVVMSAHDVLSAEKVLTASDNITLTTDANTVWISATTNAGSSVVYAPTGASYLVLNADAGLSAEQRLIQSGNSISITTDGTSVIINATTTPAIAYAPSGAYYVVLSAHDVLAAEKVLTASDNITITTDANTVWLSATTNSAVAGATYAPTGGFYVTYSAMDVLSAERVLASGTGATVRTDGTGIFVDVTTQNILGKVDTSTTLTAIYPLTGGGDLSTNRSFEVDTAFLVNTGRTITASTGLTGGGDLSADRLLSVNTNVRDKGFVFYNVGQLVGGKAAEKARIYIPFNQEVRNMQCALTTPGSGSSVDITLNLYTSPGGSATVVGSAVFADSGFIGVNSSTFTTGTLHAGSWLGHVITKSGAVVAGSNLTITLITRTS